MIICFGKPSVHHFHFNHNDSFFLFYFSSRNSWQLVECNSSSSYQFLLSSWQNEEITNSPFVASVIAWFFSCAQFNCSHTHTHTHREEGEMRNQNYFLLTKGKKLCRNWAIHSATPTTSWLQFLFEIWQFLHIEIQLKILLAFEYGLNFLFSNITMRSSSYSACKCVALKRFAKFQNIERGLKQFIWCMAKEK